MMLRLTALVVLLFSVESLAVCCRRKANFGCCGNGGCNIFCCDCDRGCNRICEQTSCNTLDWFKCGGALTACAGVCGTTGALTGGAACIACLGPLYDQCKDCYAGARRRSLMSTPGDQPDSAFEQCKMDAMGKFETDILGEAEHLQDVFDCLVSESGATSAKLDFEQTCAILGCNTTDDVTREVFDLTDANKDGVITADEFHSTLNAELAADVADAPSKASMMSFYVVMCAAFLSFAAQIAW